ncbi:winged helix-turn-helix domain-containing protein [Streptomyces huiliensis]|uniref:winged helix-turn-helix domain-containing protein n=1 Tax=Streptomyces huiliensis TaxID=2876027 RepID=UPI0035589068|nr:winged helix-turn-helix domain-containing protein [Streptomyces huiliensis]
MPPYETSLRSPRPLGRPPRPAGPTVHHPAPARITLDYRRRTAVVDGRELRLTGREFELLAHLVGRPHQAHTRRQLLVSVWGPTSVGGGRTVDVHIARLRGKLGPGHRGTIVTVRHVGYAYEPSHATTPETP